MGVKRELLGGMMPGMILTIIGRRRMDAPANSLIVKVTKPSLLFEQTSSQ